MNGSKEFEFWKKFSEKDHPFSARSDAHYSLSIEPLGSLASTQKGRILCDSGILVVCPELAVEAVESGTELLYQSPKGKPVIYSGGHIFTNLNHPALRWPNIKQYGGNKFVALGDVGPRGLFTVSSSEERFYVENLLTDLTPDLARAFREGHKLEGLALARGGSLAIVDPTLYKVSHVENARDRFELFTVLRVPKGVYSAKCIDTKERIRRLSVERVD